MTTPAPAQPTPAQSRTRRRKAQALLAGGTVLGIGAAVTLATWNDSVFAEGFFGSGTFDLEGSLTGESDDYAQHANEEAAAQLDFEAANLSPGATTYAALWVRLTEETTVNGLIEADGGITVATDEENANASALAYEIYALPASDTCGEDSVADQAPVVTAESLVASPTDGTDGAGVPLSFGEEEAGTAVQLCFAVTSDSEDFAQDTDTSAVWTVTATSVED